MTRSYRCTRCDWTDGRHTIWCERLTIRGTSAALVGHERSAPPPSPTGGPADPRKPNDGDDGPIMGHAGLGLTARQIVDLAIRGLPIYCPTDPALIDQRPYLEFAAKRGPNSA